MIDLKKVNYNKLGDFLFEEVEGEFLLTNEVGDFFFLSKNEFEDLLAGKLGKKEKIYLDLKKKGFIKDEKNLPSLSQRYATKKSYLQNGPSLHIVVVTLRCNFNCVYCHASARNMKDCDYDMSEETGRKTVERIFETSSEFVSIEFQGGEPLVNWDLIKFIVKEANEKNKKYKKDLKFSMVSNFSLMDDKKFDFLIKNKVSLTCSLDGDRLLQNKNRPFAGSDSFDPVEKWAKKFFKIYPKIQKEGYTSKMGALVTVTKFSLDRWKEIVDTYVELGFDRIFLRPINPFGFSREKWETISYSAEDFLVFYKKSLEYILELNKKGTRFREVSASTFLKKMYDSRDPGFLELRSPCGAGIGQLAYHYNGDVYSCDEGRMMSMMGDDSFLLGNVTENSLRDYIDNPVTKSLCIASCLEGLPGCQDCVLRPYCGVCPVYNYSVHGNIFPKSFSKNERCLINKGTLHYLLQKTRDKEANKIFKDWLYN